MPTNFLQYAPRPEETLGMPAFNASFSNPMSFLPGGSLFGGNKKEKFKIKIPSLGMLKFADLPDHDQTGIFDNLDFGTKEINSLFTKPVINKTVKVKSKGAAMKAYKDAIAQITEYYNTSGIERSGSMANIPANVIAPNNSSGGTGGLFGGLFGGGSNQSSPLNLNPDFMAGISKLFS